MSKTQERVIKYISKDGTVRVAAVAASQLLEAACQIQHTSPLCTVAIGRAMIGSVLMAANLKEGERVGIHFQGSGPIKTLYAESGFEGDTRGFVAVPSLDLPLKNGKLDVSGAIGIGLLHVVRTIPNQKHPYSGTVHILTGEIGDDIAFYLSQSHQIPSVVSLGVRLDEKGRVRCAGGVLVEGMPGVTEDTLALIEKNVKSSPTVSELLVNGKSIDEMVRLYLNGIELEQLEHPHELKYSCHCDKERVYRSLMMLGHVELDDMILKQDTDIECNFCGRKYKLSVEELKRLRDVSYKNSLN